MDNKTIIQKVVEFCISLTYSVHKLINIYSSVFYQLITGEY